MRWHILRSEVVREGQQPSQRDQTWERDPLSQMMRQKRVHNASASVMRIQELKMAGRWSFWQPKKQRAHYF